MIIGFIKDYRQQETRIFSRNKALVTENRKRPGVFFLASDERIGFSKKMAVDFTNTIGVQREGLEKFLANRKGRLNKIACEHFREKLSHFFHRYAWNEWYILNKEEIASHKEYSTYSPERLYDWQK